MTLKNTRECEEPGNVPKEELCSHTFDLQKGESENEHVCANSASARVLDRGALFPNVEERQQLVYREKKH